MVVESGGRRIMLLHGHRFDEFIARYPLLTWMADRLYNFLQRVDKSHYFAKLAKRKSKTFLRCAQKIEHDAVRYAARHGCDAVCCGHTHLACANTGGPVHYFNSGCWTEKPCHYLTVANGVVTLCAYTEDVPDLVLDSPEPPASPVPTDAPAPIPAVA
jgi:UDP-2,3-diacylglucosamine pyrophosphatase LpxH